MTEGFYAASINYGRCPLALSRPRVFLTFGISEPCLDAAQRTCHFQVVTRLQGGVKLPTGGRDTSVSEPASAAILSGLRVSRSGEAPPMNPGGRCQSWADG